VRTDRLQQEYGIELRWTVFPLHPETPEQGIELTELFAGKEEQIKAMQSQLVHQAALEGLPLTERTRTYNSLRAQELGKWAEQQGQGDIFRRAVYHGYFVEGINISLVDELVQIAKSVGLSGDDARNVLKKMSYVEAVNADWQRARALGITAVPTHIFEGKSLVGFGSYDEFIRLIGKDSRPIF
jgi:predicted DsbA family dithiol-disulfide isomerase